ncbi:MAG: hypothetical protein K2L07_16285 [Lachnospiraceae bacterium]|nr:hypothetical protein [Lachnospiraceae bacterium]
MHNVPKETSFSGEYEGNILSQSPSDYTVEDIIRTRYQDEVVCREKMQSYITNNM